MNQGKYIGMDVSPGNDIGCRHEQLGQASHGMHLGDESGHDSGVRSRDAGKFIEELARTGLFVAVMLSQVMGCWFSEI